MTRCSVASFSGQCFGFQGACGPKLSTQHVPRRRVRIPTHTDMSSYCFVVSCLVNEKPECHMKIFFNYYFMFIFVFQHIIANFKLFQIVNYVSVTFASALTHLNAIGKCKHS